MTTNTDQASDKLWDGLQAQPPLGKTRRGYKVVQFNQNAPPSQQLESVIVDTGQGRGGRFYQLARWVGRARSSGPLCVFNEVELARQFTNRLNCRVYECEYVPSKHTRVWRRGGWNVSGQPLSDLPHGTVLAHKVKLLKKVNS